MTDAETYIREGAEREAREHDAPLEVLLVRDEEAIAANLSRDLPPGLVSVAHMRDLIERLQWPATKWNWRARLAALTKT